ncbi:MAG: M48 family metalloprotease [Candidatus Sericytochromatia bacterium]|nr:M48 family metalloprotease [Candidatus Sericytochromatia bacterium]
MVKIDTFSFFRVGINVFLSLILGLVSPSLALAYTDADLLPLLREIIAETYPELKDITLTTGSFSESDSFFQSNFELQSLFSEQPIYRIEVNPRIWRLSLPPLALKAVLAHELAHTRDYHLGKNAGAHKLQNVLCVLNQLRLYESLRTYEHRTDLQAIFRGFGPGLKQYREWLYPLLNAEELARKQEVYYTPAEIVALMQALSLSEKAGKKSELLHYWLEKVPLNLVEIQMGIRQFGLTGS